MTFGALSDIWKFDQDQDDTVPTRSAIDARLPLIDYRKLIVDEQAGTAFLQRKGMRAHLGGIGKGYAVDRAVALLRAGRPARISRFRQAATSMWQGSAAIGRGASASRIRERPMVQSSRESS